MRRRRVRALSAIAVGLLTFGTALTALITSPAKADSNLGSGFLFLGLIAEAGGERVVFTDAATHEGEGFGELDVPFAHSELNTSKGYALTSAAWPGTAVGNFGALLVLLGAPPQAAALQDPVRAEARSNTGPSAVTTAYPSAAEPAISMNAAATPTRVVASSEMGGSKNVNVGAFGATSVSSTAQMTGVSTALASAKTVTQNLSLGPGGLISIGSVTSTAQVTTNGQSPQATGGTTVTNMKVAGFPVTVDQDGVHAQGHGASATAANAQINKALAQTQTQIFLTQPTKTSSQMGMTYDASSLLITLGNGQMYVLVGGARAIAGASLSAPYNPPVGPPSGPLAPAAPPVAGGPTAPLGTTGTTPTTAAPLPQTAPNRSIAPQLAANPLRFPDGALAPGWLVAAIIGAGLIAFGLRRLPDRLLENVATPCPIGENR